MFDLGDPYARSSTREPTVGEVVDRATRTIESELTGEPAVRGRLMASLGRVHQALGSYEASRRLLETALADVERAYGPEAPELLPILDRLAIAHGTIGDAEAAKPLLDRALAIAEGRWGPQSPRVVHPLTALGDWYIFTGDPDEARALYHRGLDILGRDDAHHPELREILTQRLAALGGTREQTDLDQVRRRLAAVEEAHGPDHPRTCTAYRDLALALEEMGRAEEAIPLYERVERIQREALGAHHPDLGWTFDFHAMACAAVGRYEEALDLGRRAQTILHDQLGEAHPEVATIEGRLARWQLELGRDRAALQSGRNATDLLRRATAAARSELLAPALTEAHLIRGLAAHRLDREEEARDHCATALERLEDGAPDAHPDLRVGALLCLDRVDEAAAVLREAARSGAQLPSGASLAALCAEHGLELTTASPR